MGDWFQFRFCIERVWFEMAAILACFTGTAPMDITLMQLLTQTGCLWSIEDLSLPLPTFAAASRWDGIGMMRANS